MMPVVGLVGLGNWAIALGQHLARKGCQVVGWSNRAEEINGINKNRRHPRCFSDIELAANFNATEDLALVMSCEYVLVVVPAATLDDVIPRLKPAPGITVISAIKGMETRSLLTPLQFMRREFGKAQNLCVLSGPSFARDVVSCRPCGVVAAAESEGVARSVAELFSSEFMKVYVSTDPLGVELGGIVKNIIAIAAGISDGLRLGDSARAGLITRGLAEMVRFAEAMGAARMTLFGLSGLGDLAMTASSDLSRNRTVGLRLGAGESLSQIIASLGSVAEGVHTTPLVLEMARKLQVEMPITEHVAELLRGETNPATMARSLITRPIKKEF